MVTSTDSKDNIRSCTPRAEIIDTTAIQKTYLLMQDGGLEANWFTVHVWESAFNRNDRDKGACCVGVCCGENNWELVLV